MKRSLIFIAAAAAVVVALPAFASGPNRASVSGLDSSWLRTSIEGDRFEIAGGKLAQDHSQNPAVRAYGARLVKDHSKSLSDAVKLAKKLNIKVPTAPSPPMEWELGVVSTMSGPVFDKWYVSLELQDHKQDITETKDELAVGRNPRVRALGRDDLPVLRKHLAIARDLSR